jgi:hypothetical protein
VDVVVINVDNNFSSYASGMPPMIRTDGGAEELAVEDMLILGSPGGVQFLVSCQRVEWCSFFFSFG